jgi:hypothetical protein
LWTRHIFAPGKALTRIDFREHKENIGGTTQDGTRPGKPAMPFKTQQAPDEDTELDAAVDEAIAACDGDLRATIRALIVANNFLECEVSELMKAVSHAYTRGRFHSYSG